MQQGRLNTALHQCGDRESRPLGGVVGGVVEHLNMQSVCGVIEGSGGLDDPRGDVSLIEQRQLHGHGRPLLWVRGRFVCGAPPNRPDHPCAMGSHGAQGQEDQQIGEEDCGLHGVPDAVQEALSLPPLESSLS